MHGAVWHKHTTLHFEPHAAVHRLRQYAAQSRACAGQQRGRLCGKQIHYGFFHIRPGELRRVPHIGVVSGKLPSALLTDAPNGIQHCVHVALRLSRKHATHKIRQPTTSRKIQRLVLRTVSGSEKTQPVHSRNGGRPGGTRRCSTGAPAHQHRLWQSSEALRRRTNRHLAQSLRQTRETFFNHGIVHLMFKAACRCRRGCRRPHTAHGR